MKGPSKENRECARCEHVYSWHVFYRNRRRCSDGRAFKAKVGA